MAFKPVIESKKKYSDIESLFRDLNTKGIESLYSHQADILRDYQKNAVDEENVAIELPTGSGKTLVGLLIGEFRRKAYEERILYICPTKQLVNQVATLANEKYGIKAVPFIGSKNNYSAQDKSSFRNGDCIAITTYSSLFNVNPFFKEANTIIVDDAHASENYIASCWSLEIDRRNHETVYKKLLETIKSKIEFTLYYKFNNDDVDPIEKKTVEKFPSTYFYELNEHIYSLLEEALKDTDLKYNWYNIKENLHACNMFISWYSILIRPIIPPSMTNKAFADANQRVFMSATLGQGGDLERITGVKSFYRIPIPAGWDKQGLGRRFFLFPNLSLENNEIPELIGDILKKTSRCVFIVSSDKKGKSWEKDIKKHLGSLKTFTAHDIESSKELFTKEENAMVILANRFDGIDFPGDESRFLVLVDIPYSANLQERFLQSRMKASIIFYDRNRTRLIQAIGRCTRSPRDYSAVCIIGDGLSEWFTLKDKLKFFHQELQAEIKFGIEQSKVADKKSFLENFELFIKQEDDWLNADSQIIQFRDNLKKEEIPGEEELKSTVGYEVDYLYAIWDENYEKAFELSNKVLDNLSGGSVLKGYRAFWSYLSGGSAWLCEKELGKDIYAPKAIELFAKATRIAPSISWFKKLSDISTEFENDYNLIWNIDSLEKYLEELKVSNPAKFQKRISEIETQVNSRDNFETGHEKIGKLLGFKTGNPDSDGAPDPYWISAENLVFVFEDKIYDNPEHNIKLEHIRQARTHGEWIKANIKTLKVDCKIITVIISNRSTVGEESKHACDDIYFWEHKEFLNFSKNVLKVISTMSSLYTGDGEYAWGEYLIKEFNENKFSPQHIESALKPLSELL